MVYDRNRKGRWSKWRPRLVGIVATISTGTMKKAASFVGAIMSEENFNEEETLSDEDIRIAQEVLFMEEIFNAPLTEPHRNYPSLIGIAANFGNVLTKHFLDDVELSTLDTDSGAVIFATSEDFARRVAFTMYGLFCAIAAHYEQVGPLLSEECTKDHSQEEKNDDAP